MNRQPMRLGKYRPFRDELRNAPVRDRVSSGTLGSSLGPCERTNHGRRVPRKPTLDEQERAMH